MTAGPYGVQLTRPAVRSLARLASKDSDAVLRFIEGPLTENPQRVTQPLTGELNGLRSGWVGISYRVLVRVDDDALTVHVVRIVHRADAYRPD